MFIEYCIDEIESNFDKGSSVLYEEYDIEYSLLYLWFCEKQKLGE
jgi:hypothetical protein